MTSKEFEELKNLSRHTFDLGYMRDVEEFIQANFLPKSEVKEAIESMREKRHHKDNEGYCNTCGEYRCPHNIRQNTLEDLKSKLKLE